MLFEFEEGGSRKFYRVERRGLRVELQWGRIGTEGRGRVHTFETEAEAVAAYERQLAERIARGYREVRDESVPHVEDEKVRTQRLGVAKPLSSSARFFFKQRSKFVWVEARGATLLVARGPVGDEGLVTPTEKSFASEREALRARDAAVAQLLEKGYELSDFAAKAAPAKRPSKPAAVVWNAEAEAAIRRAPNDERAWAVLEDWVLEQQDVRAALVRVKRGEGYFDTELRERALKAFFGKSAAALDAALGSVDWRAGYLQQVSLHLDRNVEAVLRSFLTAPVTSLLGRLWLNLPFRKVGALGLLAEAQCVDSVREVQLSLEEAPSGALVDPRPLGALTSLDELWVNEAWLLPGPVLERLSALFCAVRPQHLEAFTTLNFDRLTALSLELAAETEPQHLEAFLTGRTVPRLELLELQVDGRHDEWLALVGQSAVLPRLQVLRLGSREPRPDEVTPAFAHLREFQLP